MKLINKIWIMFLTAYMLPFNVLVGIGGLIAKGLLFHEDTDQELIEIMSSNQVPIFVLNTLLYIFIYLKL